MKYIRFSFLVLLFLKAEAQTSPVPIADSLYALGNYTKAINAYAKSGNAMAALQIARSYKAIGNFEKAIKQYQTITEQNPNFLFAQFELGKLLLKVKEFDKAKTVFSNLVQWDTANPEYHYYLAEANQELQQTYESLHHYTKAITLDSTHLRSIFQMAKYNTIKQERDKALGYIAMGLRLYANDVAMINLKALVLYNDFQFKNAIPFFERLLELGETKDYVYEKLAYCYYQNWEFEKAKQAYNLLIIRNDTNPQTYFSLADVYVKENKLDSAKIVVNKALEVQRPIFAQGYSSLAEIARQQKDLDTALTYYRMAHDEDPADARNFYNICTIYDQLGKDDNKKLEYYQNFLKQYPNEHPYFYESVKKRIRELKEQIHYSKD